MTDSLESKKPFDREFFLNIIDEWKTLWMNQKQNSEEDYKNYFRRAFGVDANMSYSLARMCSEKALEAVSAESSDTPNETSERTDTWEAKYFAIKEQLEKELEEVKIESDNLDKAHFQERDLIRRDLGKANQKIAELEAENVEAYGRKLYSRRLLESNYADLLASLKIIQADLNVSESEDLIGTKRFIKDILDKQEGKDNGI
jgi:hypothetical protein